LGFVACVKLLNKLCKQIPSLKQGISFTSPILKDGVDIRDMGVSDLKRIIDRIPLLPEKDKMPKETGNETTSRIAKHQFRHSTQHYCKDTE
jgi:hypothetical protein